MTKPNLAIIRPYLAIALIFGCLYALISFTNHYYFRTYALDLGLYTNTMYDYAHGRMATMAMIPFPAELALADHFDLYLMLFSPLVFIFGSYTLLVVQLLSLLIGGLGVYRYFPDRRTSILASIFFLSFFGFISALGFDYHSNVVTAAILPWLFLTIKKERFITSFVLLIFLLVGKENMSFWLAFVCLGLAILYRKDRLKFRFSLVFSAFSLVYFIAMIKFFMPALADGQEYLHFSYNVLGKDLSSAIHTLITHPIESTKIFFTNHQGVEYGNFVKFETHLLLFLSGVAILFRRPAYLIMLLPIYFQKFFHNEVIVWSHGAQYSVEFAPVLAIGVFSVINGFRKHRNKTILGIVITVFSIGSTIRTLDQPFDHIQEENTQFYKSQHYEKDYDVRTVHSVLNTIPKDAPVSAISSYVPHLALRRDIYQFPIINNAQFIVVSTKESPWPCTYDQFFEQLDTLKRSHYWYTAFSNEHLFVFKRRSED